MAKTRKPRSLFIHLFSAIVTATREFGPSKIESRLTGLILVTTIPLLIGIIAVVGYQERLRLGASVTLILVGALVTLVLYRLTIRRILRPIHILMDTFSAIARGDLNRVARVETSDEIGALVSVFNEMMSQLRNIIGSLERRVTNLTDDLQLAAGIGRIITERVRPQSEILMEAVEMIRARFDLYSTQIYLTDPAGRKIILCAGTGAIGKELLERGHNLIINSNSLNGLAVIEKHAQIITNTKQNSNFLPNPLLPNTGSEISIPLMVNGKVLGVLDMQSEKPGTFSENNLPALQALAGQLAIAIENAALFPEVQEARSGVEAHMDRLTEQGWQDFLNAIDQGHRIGFAFNDSRVARLRAEILSTMSNANGFNLPIMVAGARIGEIQLPVDLKPDELELVRSIGDQLGQHLENLRLLVQAEMFRKEAELAIRRLTREGWETYLRGSNQWDIGYVYDLNQVQPLTEDNTRNSDQSIKQPIVVRDETIGELKLDLPELPDHAIKMLLMVVQQLSGHLENLWLAELNERNAQREQALRKITSALRSSTNPTTIMRTAARELGSILGRRTAIQVIPPHQVDLAKAGGDNEIPRDSMESES